MKYCARPNTGIVLPGSVCNVTVTMQAQNEALIDMQCKDKFLLQAVLAPNGTTINDLTADMFNKEENKVIEEFKLTVAYILANPHSPVEADPTNRHFKWIRNKRILQNRRFQDKLLILGAHNILTISGPWSPEEDEMLLNLFEKHGPGNWSLIGKSIPGRTRTTCMSRWLSLQRSFTPEEEEMLQNLVKKHGPNWSLIRQPAPSLSALLSSISRTIGGAQNGNLSHEVGGVRGHQAPSIGDMARDDISTQGTHIYSRDGSAPTWNALNERDSSVVTDDDWIYNNAQEFEGDEYDWKNLVEGWEIDFKI
ncbi:vesicle-associated protein 1-3 [Tanacetum coccineum]